MDGVFWHLTENKEDDMERHKFALETFKTLLTEKKAFARMNAVDECIQIVKRVMEESDER